jgi:hypothetical protein
MKQAAALATLVLALGGCSLPSMPDSAPLPGEARVKKVDRVYFQDPPAPNLYRIEFDAARSKAIRERAALESPWDRSVPYHAFIQYFEVVAEKELRSRSLCNGTAGLVSDVDGINGTGPLSAIFVCRPPLL